jgi:hypothetical protein
VSRRPSPLTRDLLLIAAAFGVLRVLAVVGKSPVSFPDTGTYFTFNLLGGENARLWTIPLVFKAMPSDPARVAAQVAIGIGCWGALAVETGRALRNPVVARIGAALVLILALTVEVTQWDLTLLSESITVSLMALGVALALWLGRRGGLPVLLAALLGAVVLWAFTRYVSAVSVALLFPLGAGLALWRLPRRTAWVTVAALLLTSAWSLYAVSRQDFIWRVNAYQIILQRILPDDEATRYFTDRGLEVTQGLRRASRENLGPNTRAFTDPRFQRWLEDEWRRAYASYLLRHWASTIWDPLHETPTWASEDTKYSKPRHVLPRRAENLLWNPGHDTPALLALGGGALLLWLLSLLRGPPSPVELVPWVLVLLGIVQAELVWNYAASELGRLFVPPGATLRLGFLLLALFAADRLLTARATASP